MPKIQYCSNTSDFNLFDRQGQKIAREKWNYLKPLKFSANSTYNQDHVTHPKPETIYIIRKDYYGRKSEDRRKGKLWTPQEDQMGEIRGLKVDDVNLFMKDYNILRAHCQQYR